MTDLEAPLGASNSIEALRTMIHGDRPPVVLVGSGLSAAMGYPAWPGLIEDLHSHLETLSPPAPAGEEQAVSGWYAALKGMERDPLWQAEAYKNALPDGEFEAFIADRYGHKGHELKGGHLILGQLPFRVYLTTNFDPAIEMALAAAKRKPRVSSWSNGKAVTDLLRNLPGHEKAPRLVYLHGRYNKPKELILTESSYVTRYIASDDARRKLLAIFLTQSVLFVGFSMDDPDLSQIMREVAARLGRKSAHHYAIFGARGPGEKRAICERMQGKFGINTITYDMPSDKDHSRLLDLLEGLRNPPGGATARAAAPSRMVADTPRPNAVNSLDPQKGQWGGQSVRGAYVLSAEMVEKAKDWIRFELIVRRQDSKPFTAPVTFHLHDSFPRTIVEEAPVNGAARLRRWAYGAFTAGAEVEGVQLELDLAELDIFPKWFRER